MGVWSLREGSPKPDCTLVAQPQVQELLASQILKYPDPGITFKACGNDRSHLRREREETGLGQQLERNLFLILDGCF